MSAVEPAFGVKSGRVETVKAEVLYEHDSIQGAVNISASFHEEICVYSRPTNHPDWRWLLLNNTYAHCISRWGAYSVFSCPITERFIREISEFTLARIII